MKANDQAMTVNDRQEPECDGCPGEFPDDDLDAGLECCRVEARRAALRALRVHHHTLHPWAQPGDEPNRVFILRFADPDMREQVFTGEGAQERAFEAYRKYSPAWNVYLFATVASAELAR